ncbi:MAG TPA: hypothetical protein VHH32_05725 [Gemmatimonadales bacterium]|nr:hypothetical protein [Gemmatimonadales bacterium]
MCYFLYIASPLTLSEVRSMLPPGLVADLAPSAYRAALQQLHPSAKTVARLLVGSCSCDLVRTRQADPIADERELRARFQQARLPRSAIIHELELHRRGPVPRPAPPDDWPGALTRFVVEHARNAGRTLYLLHFGRHAESPVPALQSTPKIFSAREIGARPGSWLVEGIPTLIS